MTGTLCVLVSCRRIAADVADGSIPHIPFVMRNRVLLQQLAVLVLERDATVMPLWVGDVLDDGGLAEDVSVRPVGAGCHGMV